MPAEGNQTHMAHQHKWSNTQRLRASAHAESAAGARKQPYPGFRISRTSMGKGVFAARPFDLGEVVGEITGETIVDPDYCSRYAFDLENGNQLEPAAPFRFVNHSCDPNCSFEVIDVHNGSSRSVRRQIMLFAIYIIGTGDELTIDYNWPVRFAIPCKCRSEYCRGWVVGEQHLSEDPEMLALSARQARDQAAAPTELD